MDEAIYHVMVTAHYCFFVFFVSKGRSQVKQQKSSRKEYWWQRCVLRCVRAHAHVCVPVRVYFAIITGHGSEQRILSSFP